ncbi:MAG: hypothetical protein DRI01_10025, partial [Chloroflexi bacterium]
SNDPFINFPVKRNLTNKPLPHFLKNPCLPTGRHYSIIPIFHVGGIKKDAIKSYLISTGYTNSETFN